MKYKVLATMFFLAKVVFLDIPIFEAPFFIQANGEDIVFKYFPDPCVADWDSDGLDDLIIGYDYGSKGRVKLFLNSGTATNPLYTIGTSIYADGSKITVNGG